MDLDRRFPQIAAMETAARRRIPHFAYDYFVGGIGEEVCLRRNRQALQGVQLLPRYLVEGADRPECGASLLGRSYDAPFGVAPVGLGGLLWPKSAEIIAAAARRHNLPFILSNYATTSLETLRTIAGSHAWFQLYYPNRPAVLEDLLRRAGESGYDTLVVTLDIPVTTRRARDIANGLCVPPKFTLGTWFDVLRRPAWALATLRAGIPVFENQECYAPKGADLDEKAAFLSGLVEGHVTPQALRRLRADWRGRLLVKGILDPADARLAQSIGVDGMIVSNHGGRQLDAAPTAVEALPTIREAVGPDMALMVDGGVRSGLDIARYLALGADFVFLGRAFLIACAAAGAPGADHAMVILKQELSMTLAQIGCSKLAELPAFLAR